MHGTWEGGGMGGSVGGHSTHGKERNLNKSQKQASESTMENTGLDGGGRIMER